MMGNECHQRLMLVVPTKKQRRAGEFIGGVLAPFSLAASQVGRGMIAFPYWSNGAASVGRFVAPRRA